MNSLQIAPSVKSLLRHEIFDVLLLRSSKGVCSLPKKTGKLTVE